MYPDGSDNAAVVSRQMQRGAVDSEEEIPSWVGSFAVTAAVVDRPYTY